MLTLYKLRIKSSKISHYLTMGSPLSYVLVPCVSQKVNKRSTWKREQMVTTVVMVKDKGSFNTPIDLIQDMEKLRKRTSQEGTSK